MKHLIATLAIGSSTALAALAFAGPAGASDANRGCPSGWQLVSASLYPPLTGGSVDFNGDGLICIMYPVPQVAQSQEPFGNFFIYIDNDTPLPTS